MKEQIGAGVLLLISAVFHAIPMVPAQQCSLLKESMEAENSDGIYEPDCDENGDFKVIQCYGEVYVKVAFPQW